MNQQQSVLDPLFLSTSMMVYGWREKAAGRCVENAGLTWVSLRGRSSAACYRGWLSWCKRHGSQRSPTLLCSAAPGPERTERKRDALNMYNFLQSSRVKTTSLSFPLSIQLLKFHLVQRTVPSIWGTDWNLVIHYQEKIFPQQCHCTSEEGGNDGRCESFTKTHNWSSSYATSDRG